MIDNLGLKIKALQDEIEAHAERVKDMIHIKPEVVKDRRRSFAENFRAAMADPNHKIHREQGLNG